MFDHLGGVFHDVTSEVAKERAERKLAQLADKHSKHPLPPDIMAKVRAENRRQTFLKYLLIVLFGIALLAIASIVDAQVSPASLELALR